MNGSPFFTLTVVGVYLLGLAVLLAKGFNSRKRIQWLAVLLWILGVWPIVTNLSIPRDLDYLLVSAKGWHMEYEWHPTLVWVGRLSTLAIVACLLATFARTARKGLPQPGHGLWISFLLFASTPILSSLFGSGGGGFTHALLRPLLISSALYLAVNESPGRMILYAKRFCLAFVYGSLVTAVLRPGWAVLVGMPGVISWFSSRLFGVSVNPNGLGPIALLYLYLDLAEPSRSWMKWLGRLAALAVLIWAQSKTVWAAALFGVAIKIAYSSRPILIRNLPRSLLLRYSLTAILCFPALGLIWNPSLSALREVGIESGTIVNLSGRTELWRITLEEWKNSPLIGYGPNLWNEEYRSKHFFVERPYASQAHNMVIQTLGESGLLGLVMFMTFVLVLVKMAWQTRDISKGLSLCLVSMPLVHCLTESTFRSRNIDETTFVTMGIFGTLIVWEKIRQARRNGIWLITETTEPAFREAVQKFSAKTVRPEKGTNETNPNSCPFNLS